MARSACEWVRVRETVFMIYNLRLETIVYAAVRMTRSACAYMLDCARFATE